MQWTHECQKEFKRVKELCCLAPILAFTDFTMPFILHTDASSIGHRAVLYQEIDGKARVNGYMAHKLKFVALK